MTDTFFFVAAAAGASLQETIYVHDMRYEYVREVQEHHYKYFKEFQNVIKTWAFWSVSLLMISLSTLGTWIWFYGETARARDVFFTGAVIAYFLKSFPRVAGAKFSVGDKNVLRGLDRHLSLGDRGVREDTSESLPEVRLTAPKEPEEPTAEKRASAEARRPTFGHRLSMEKNAPQEPAVPEKPDVKRVLKYYFRI